MAKYFEIYHTTVTREFWKLRYHTEEQEKKIRRMLETEEIGKVHSYLVREGLIADHEGVIEDCNLDDYKGILYEYKD